MKKMNGAIWFAGRSLPIAINVSATDYPLSICRLGGATVNIPLPATENINIRQSIESIIAAARRAVADGDSDDSGRRLLRGAGLQG